MFVLGFYKTLMNIKSGEMKTPVTNGYKHFENLNIFIILLFSTDLMETMAQQDVSTTILYIKAS